MVVEMLVFEIAETDQPGWLEVEEQVWTAFLRFQPGFARKEIWRRADRPSELTVVI